ncbi:MAG: flagellar hook-associated protein 2 [Actinomycetota bacterium]|jgi:flagellar hook-associated protein 2|nr:flagellar hook-associated protein 2 [Actinomycetota bacterium]
MASIDGLISGLNTTTIIAQLMAIERQPKAQLVNAQTAGKTLVTTLQSLNSLITSLQTSAKAFVPDTITGLSDWNTSTATSSNSSLASVMVGAGAVPGNTSFTVTAVATAGAAVSLGTVSSLTDPVAGGPFMLSKGVAALGLSAPVSGASLSSGAHTVEVTQSSAAATLTGSPIAGFDVLPPAVTIDATNNVISVYRDGEATPTTITLAQGTYSPAELAAEISNASGGTVSGSVDSGGRLTLANAREGSATSLQLADTNVSLGLTDTLTVAQGVDGVISLDGVETTVNTAGSGDEMTLAGVDDDSIVVTLTGGLRKGVATTTAVAVAAGATLAEVAAALNGPGTGVSAVAVKVADGSYRLQVGSTTTGSASDITLSADAFPPGWSSLGVMQQLSAGADTVLHVGTGAGAFDVTSATTSVTGLLTGVTITALKADPATVTVNVVTDSGGIADKMAAMVAQANAVLSFVNDKSAYDATTKTGGPLVGASLGRDLIGRITDVVIGSSSSTPAMSGVAVARDGSITFDRAAFLAAYAQDPAAVTTTMTSMAQQLSDVATQASDPHTGFVTGWVTSEQDAIQGITSQIAAFEDRMTMRQQTLQTQYAALETMLGKLKSQSEWLTSQLATLPTSNSK